MVLGGFALGSVPLGGRIGKADLSHVLSIPNTTTDLKTMRFGHVPNTQVFESPISGSTQTAELTGGKWMATFNLVPFNRADAQAWIVFLTRLRGMSGRFYAHDPSNAVPRGTIAGSNPLIVSGASQTGTSLNTKGWAATTTVLKAGDAIAFDTATWRERHIVTDDVVLDGSGLATLSLAFPMRQSPLAEDPLIVTNASCIMRLLDNQQAFWDVREALRFGIQFTGIEVFK